MENAHFLTNAIVLIPAMTGGDSPGLCLQQSDSTVSGGFTTLLDSNASIQVTAGTGVYVLTGQRTKKYCRIQLNPGGASDTITAYGQLFGFQKLSPFGATGISRSPSS